MNLFKPPDLTHPIEPGKNYFIFPAENPLADHPFGSTIQASGKEFTIVGDHSLIPGTGIVAWIEQPPIRGPK